MMNYVSVSCWYDSLAMVKKKKRYKVLQSTKIPNEICTIFHITGGFFLARPSISNIGRVS